MNPHDIPTVLMKSGFTMPVFGYGTYKVLPNVTQKLVETAIELGVRHIDTAQMYGNEREVGYALKALGVPREELFVTTKLNNCNHEERQAKASFYQSLSDLGVDYVDLFLIHWPLPTLYNGDYVSTWRVMQEFQESGKARSVGVSNFQIHHLKRIIKETGIVPAVNQVEIHPQFPNNALRAFHQKYQIVTQAWSPLGRGQYFDDPVIVAVAKRYEKSAAQVMLRWAIQRGDVVFPKASSKDRIRQNMDIFDWCLDEADMEKLNRLDRGEAGRRGSHPDTMDLLRVSVS